LAQLSVNPLFGMIHPRQLEELTQRFCPSALPFISSLINRQPNALLNRVAALHSACRFQWNHLFPR
jgi:hypothetical protein